MTWMETVCWTEGKSEFFGVCVFWCDELETQWSRLKHLLITQCQFTFFHFHFVFSSRPFTIPQVLRKGNKPEDDDEGEDEEEEQTLPVLKSFQIITTNIAGEKKHYFWLILELNEDYLSCICILN